LHQSYRKTSIQNIEKTKGQRAECEVETTASLGEKKLEQSHYEDVYWQRQGRRKNVFEE